MVSDGPFQPATPTRPQIWRSRFRRKCLGPCIGHAGKLDTLCRREPPAAGQAAQGIGKPTAGRLGIRVARLGLHQTCSSLSASSLASRACNTCRLISRGNARAFRSTTPCKILRGLSLPSITVVCFSPYWAGRSWTGAIWPLLLPSRHPPPLLCRPVEFPPPATVLLL